MTKAAIEKKVVASILGRFAMEKPHREEALRDVLGLTVPTLDEDAARGIAAMVPQLPMSLYEKWAKLFAKRLLETASPAQLEELLLGTEESDATLALVYVMFMESERMEKMVAADLKELGLSLSGAEDGAAQVGAWLKNRMSSPRG